MTSILTNNGAMVALQTLKGINNDLMTTQSQISTGKKVANASDNAAAWAISKVMEADVSTFNKIEEGLGTAEKTAATAGDAASDVVEHLKAIRDLTAQASNDTLNAKQRETITTDIESLKAQIETAVSSAQFNGVNLLDGSKDGDAAATPPVPGGMKVLSSMNRAADGTVTPAFITVDSHNLTTAAGGGLEALGTLDVSDAAASETSLKSMDAMIDTAVAAAASFGTAQNEVQSQSNFVSRLSDNMESGIGELVDADMEEASARLKALQTQQQLGTQALSIANQAPQSVLSLFR